jgi:hypothetical protein
MAKTANQESVSAPVRKVRRHLQRPKNVVVLARLPKRRPNNVAKVRVKKPEQPLAGKSHLEPGDHTQLLVAERNLSVLKACYERDSAQADLLKLQAQIQVKAIEQKLNESYLKHQQAVTLHRQLADDIALRYAISWKTCCFEPNSGEIKELPPEP